MSQPIYFFPGLRAASIETLALRRGVLATRGLGNVFDGLSIDEAPCFDLPGAGPGNHSGCVMCYQTAAGQVPGRWGYYPAEQTWTPIGDGSQLWIGFYTNDAPTPDELARPKRIRGYDVTLGDGRKWQVPVIRRPNAATLLPRSFSRGKDGRLAETVRKEFEPHFEAFRDVSVWIYGGMQVGEFDQREAIDLAIRALGINYRFTWNEQDTLQLIGDDNFLVVLAAAVDLFGFDAVADDSQKKSDPTPAPSTSPGPPADLPTTSPASANSSSSL